jgi:cellulose synthase/poly-beta-1,6-N-acetylglucosamine synthase-like glycosyltransferase
MKNPLVSILIPARNEEKLIGRALDYIKKIIDEEYKNIEVIVGSDSTDKTNEIVKKYKFAKLITAKRRLGKNSMLNRLYKIARGEIIIVHDADWYLVSNNNFKNLIKYFKNPKIGGIENFTIFKFNEKDSPLVFAESFIGEWLHHYKIKKQSKVINGKLYVKNNIFPFYVNIFRKSALNQEQVTICDDGERTIQIMKNGYLVAIPQGDMLPYFLATEASPSVSDFLKQKIRGHTARKQVKQKYGDCNASLLGFYLPAFLYTVKLSFKLLFGVLLYWFLALIVLGKAKKSMSVRECWKMRLKR